VYGNTQNLDSIKFKDETFTGFDNTLCLLTGESSNTFFFAPVLLLLTATVVLTDVYICKLLLDNLKNNGSLSKFVILVNFLGI